MSVEMPNGRWIAVWKGSAEPAPPAGEKKRKNAASSGAKERFRGVRIFDISDIKNPKQSRRCRRPRIAYVTMVVDPKDKETLYLRGRAIVRSSAGRWRVSREAPTRTDTAVFRIEVIKFQWLLRRTRR